MSPRSLTALAFALAALAVAIAVLRGSAEPEASAPAVPGGAARTPVTPPQSSLSSTEATRPHLPGPALAAPELHALLREQAEPVAAAVSIADLSVTDGSSEIRLSEISAGAPIEVCAGRALELSAQVSRLPPGAIERWVWPGPGGAELHPGGVVAWRAPEEPGALRVLFQVCTDLGGRRVGVLAERALALAIRACAPDGDRDGPSGAVRLSAVPRGPGGFQFTVALAESADPVDADAVVDYAWSFGDGRELTSTSPTVRHDYPLDALVAADIGHLVARVHLRRASGRVDTAHTRVLLRADPGERERGAAELDIARPRLDAAGQRWLSAIAVRAHDGQPVDWQRLERVTRYDDERVDIAALAWDEVLDIEASLAGGGFRGHVVVPVASVGPEVKQIIDVLYGRGADGEEVSLSWSSFKRAPSP